MNNYQLEQYLNDYYAMLRKITEPIRQLAESYTEQIKQIQQVVSDAIKPSIDKANEALREYHEKIFLSASLNRCAYVFLMVSTVSPRRCAIS